MEDGDESVLSKLLKINPDYAFIMAMDMLLAGIDTVTNEVQLKMELFINFTLRRPLLLWLICCIT